MEIVSLAQKITYIRTRFGQNQCLWSHFGDTMSPGLGGVFSVHEEGGFSKNSGIVQLAEMEVVYTLFSPL